MPFREKAKALFRRKDSAADSLSKTTSSSNSSRERWPSNIYKPGETMPRPKYRKPPTKEHKEKLESFSFGDAWRRKSYQSNYSPMGTRAPSRSNSLFRRKSHARSSRANSVASLGDGEKCGPRQREMHSGAMITAQLSTEVEADGDDDVTNVGLSRAQSREQVPTKSRPRTADNIPPDCSDYFGSGTAHDHRPFSEHELTLALQRSHLAVPARG
ncbi:hypothetical protein LTR02_016968 [Friedmanniomyces endolithicus]|nr:hypothetical protein LTR94_020486 [Friedmanniomyces endolithicus]KAK0770453.1 hypothetical protein LTR59_016503 [Friedmanniomyces endolithicus]KAK0773723.1 hypothetical protein LTR38_016464 [Friedmanniomyces endolithicus]KAK0776892.1 hypothetical protein LTR75_016100 [Friedmanniomyces endolithicus]KAK0835282.1 hypothetical protein LTR03_014062 [Friedmanniomyces endolithicus]